MPKELPKDALFLAPPFRTEKRSAQASAHGLRLFVSLGPFIRGKIRRVLLNKTRTIPFIRACLI